MDPCTCVVRLRYALRQPLRKCIRNFSLSAKTFKGLVLGVYEPQEKEGQLILTPAARHFDQSVNGQLQKQLTTVAGQKLKPGKSRILYNIGSEYSILSITNLGKQDSGFCHLEQFDEGRENIRTAAGNACVQLRDAGETSIEIDPSGDAEAVAEGSLLSLFSYDCLKAEKKRKPQVHVSCYTKFLTSDRAEMECSWSRGKVFAEAQNFSRSLMEAPANMMTPTAFSQKVSQHLQPLCSVITRDGQWAESEKMGAFLAVAKGSNEPPCFLEIIYQGGQPSDPPIALVGKGITFDSGGISLKPSADMDKMRADMGGAACVAASIMAASHLKLPINIRGFIALCENMPSGKAVKPGDVVTARNGKTIQIDNTDAEGRLILADTLCYAETFHPKLLLDIATLTGAIDVALGAGAAGVYTNCISTWDLLQKAGSRTGDRLWRMPLFKMYKKQVTESHLADINNIGKYSRSAGSCTAAAFLQEFVTCKCWVHVDMAGVMINKDEVQYLGKGMSGRPTRTLIEFLHYQSQRSS